MPGDDGAVWIDQDRAGEAEAEALDRGDDLIDLAFGVRAHIAGVRNEVLDRPIGDRENGRGCTSGPIHKGIL